MLNDKDTVTVGVLRKILNETLEQKLNEKLAVVKSIGEETEKLKQKIRDQENKICRGPGGLFTKNNVVLYGVPVKPNEDQKQQSK